MPSLKPGVLAASILIASLIYIAQALLLQSQAKATLFKAADDRRILSYDKADCERLSFDISQYCENINVTRYGYTVVVASPAKVIPDNAYVAGISDNSWRYPCFVTNYSGSGPSICRPPAKVFSSASLLFRDDKLFVVLNMLVSLSVLTTAVYILLEKVGDYMNRGNA